ncbi:Pyruvate/2-oxoglutarate dehydrogenase complex, dihydrolipoamide dehydrogenase (E3) component [Desulfonatronum thiosulfatophilum]|uniref:Pyruvate/2-oxoglutarate dehydrogenase complex, dihydrolipoamide dehydrogenase (E3) component n=1 Tax=Desulfonatronum thiosulfatophilum TaxID=617002 RepID=A0A1G6AK52_9BACT|nr:FAD-dependent oxidoreductase [Desulfonatronum thiosulfatophilum]SDB08791.1 Pyruvate/2-oxoglutarate dehydrogenase complex, dihydrolipoamide dehydrogenase (E3) component [Desulfonatronum thiosulfatophilum]
MPKYDYDIAVIGAGAAGLTVAAGASQAGAKTLLVEQEPNLGGDCLHYGCVPSKTLIRTSHVYHQMKNAARYGLPDMDVPAVDFRRVRERIQRVIATIQPHDSPERFCGLGVQVKFGRAVFLDDHQVLIETNDGKAERVSSKTWVVATGSSAAVPPLEGLDATPYLTNREIFSLDALPSSLAILGGGPIAVELAQAFARLGSRVEVIQRSGQILSKEDEDMAGLVQTILEREGVRFHLNTELLRVRDLGHEREIFFRTGNGEESSVKAAALLVALGRKATVHGLGLSGVRVEHDHKGIKVDARLRTSQKHIFACGDVTGAYQFTHAAGYEGGVVVANAVFHLPRKADYTWMPACTYTDPEFASLGLNEKQARQQGLEYTLWTEEFAENDRSLAEEEREGRIKLLLDRKNKPLGVQIVGPRAGELLSEWVAVVNGKVKLSTMAGAVHPYPTLAEINKRVAGRHLSEKIFSDGVKKTLKFFFGFKGRACGNETGKTMEKTK